MSVGGAIKCKIRDLSLGCQVDLALDRFAKRSFVFDIQSIQCSRERSVYHIRSQEGIYKPLNRYAGTYGAYLLHTMRVCEPKFAASRVSMFAAIPLTLFPDP